MDLKKIHVLIIEDDQEDFLLAKQFLKSIPNREYSIDWENDYDNAFLRIAQQDHDVYLVDYNLGNNTGVDLVAQAVNSGISKPFIFLTGMDDLQIDEKAFEAGAMDYLIKQKITKDTLERSIRYAIRQKKTEKLLLESNNTKNKLFSIISHDLRAPLATLINSFEILSDSKMDVDEDMKVNIIRELSKTTKNTLDLLDNLLSWSLSQIGALTLKNQKMSLDDLIQHVFALLEGNRKQKSINFIKNVEGDLEIFADKNAINTVIRNLVSNAIKYTPEMGTIEVGAHKVDSELTIWVKDNGVGMNKLTLSRILEGETFHSTPGTNNEKGTGLGLIITRELIEKMEGVLNIESEEGNGSIFKLILPQKY